MAERHNQEEKEIRKRISEYVAGSPYRLNPDAAVVDRIFKGLVMRKIKYGEAYCPCRFVTGDKEKDKKIVCPCIYHIEEIKYKGECYCNFIVSTGYQGKNNR